jgi:plastocyanin
MTRRVTCAETITASDNRVLFRTSVATLLVCVALVAGRETAQLAAQQTARGATGKLEGQVRLVMPPVSALPSGVYPSRRVSRPAPKTSEITNVVVFLKDAPRHGELPVQHSTISQKDEAFIPRVVAITRGSTIDFPNADPFFHNVFSLSRGASFDLGRYPSGETKSKRFTAAGLVKVYCHIHSHMTASIMVFDHPYFRIPAADGTFTIDDVPAGTYQVSAWHERIGESLSSVRIDAGRTTRIEFALPVEQR